MGTCDCVYPQKYTGRRPRPLLVLFDRVEPTARNQDNIKEAMEMAMKYWTSFKSFFSVFAVLYILTIKVN